MAGTTETSWPAPRPTHGRPGRAQGPSCRRVQAIIRWGGALLELAHFQQGSQANEMIDEAATKFKEALKINPRKHDALWCLGNAYTSQARARLRRRLRARLRAAWLTRGGGLQGFLSNEESRARSLFDKARDCFQRALAEARGALVRGRLLRTAGV